MTATDLQWLVGISLTVFVALASIMIGASRNLGNKMSKSVAELHARIDHVKDNYVRRDDLDRHLERIDGNVNELRREIRHGNEMVMNRFDQIIERLSLKSGGN